jgi:hypothetical protein
VRLNVNKWNRNSAVYFALCCRFPGGFCPVCVCVRPMQPVARRGLLRRAKEACLAAAYSCCGLLCLDACPTSSARCRSPLPLPRAICSLPSILLLPSTPGRTNHAGSSLRCSGTAPRDRKVPARCGAVVCAPACHPPSSCVLHRVRYTPVAHAARRWSRDPPPPLPLHKTTPLFPSKRLPPSSPP